MLDGHSPTKKFDFLKKGELEFMRLSLVLFLFLHYVAMSIEGGRVVILGAGIHGASIAYHLKDLKPIVIDNIGVAAAASGKSGGFLARNWGSGPTVQLHTKSFDYHEVLAKELNLKSYRKIDTYQVNGNINGEKFKWLDRKVSVALMDTDTAQITPIELTTRMMEEVERSGGEVVIGDCSSIVQENDVVRSIDINGNRVEVEKLIIALGPWTGAFCESTFNFIIPCEGIKSTSIVFHGINPIQQNPFACFCEEDNNSCHLEIYPRNDNTVYVCGIGGSDYVKGPRLASNGEYCTADKVLADPSRVNAALKSLRAMSSVFDVEPAVTQSCMRPVTIDGLPVMGKLSPNSNVIISSFHNCWGILWAPICGKAIGELVLQGESKSIDLRPFTPSRFNNIDKNKSRGKNVGGNKAVGEQW